MSAATASMSPLNTADAAFRLLTQGPRPLSLDGTELGEALPQRPIPLDELKRLLLRPSADAATRDAAWTKLVTRARDEGSAWVIGTVGVAMPALRRVAGQLARGLGKDITADIDAEVLTGFLAAVQSVDLSRRAIALRLRWAAYRAGAAFRAKALDQPAPVEDQLGHAVMTSPWGHPDLVLADAISQGVITPAEAALIATTRLELVPLTVAAEDLAVQYDTARMRRSRAEARLTSAIRAGQFNGRASGGIE